MSNKRIKLDKIDRKILKDLQENGRITNVKLAEHAGISAPPCLRRVRALEESGFIKSYHADIDASAMGYGMMVFVQVKLSGQSDGDIKRFESQCEKWDMVREAHLVSGDVDFLLRVVARDWESAQKFLRDDLAVLEGVVSTKTMPLMRTAKQKPGVPIDIDR